MFKSLLRTLPTLSGNFTLACKINEYNQLSSKEYEVNIRDAALIPLQNSMFNKNIGINLAKDQYEHTIKKYFKRYSDVFYKENYSYNKQDFVEYDDYEINKVNDSRNKDYEFGCKRLYYSQMGYQFMFYAPFYIDDIEDLPDYFIINLQFNDTITKKVKVLINKKNSSNYLRVYLTSYVKQLDNNVIFCLPESKQATYCGIDVKHGGIVKYIDNVFGDLYNNQNTINNFDYTICTGFVRNNLIMKQIIPISFLFNINDLLNYHELKFFEANNIKVSGYYIKNNVKYDFYDFSIDYTNLYHKYLKYDEYSGKYEMNFGYDTNDNKINIMNVSYPSLNESKYVKYRFTNKITPTYCRFKLQQSEDEHPYIVNMSYAFSSMQNPNTKYGEFPTLFKDIFPVSIVKNNNMILPIKSGKETYIENNEANFSKYIKLMSNFYSSWYNIFNLNDDIFDNDSYWSDVDNNYSYFKGVLYKLSNETIKRDDIDKFGIFLNVQMDYINNSSVLNDIVIGKYILSQDKYNNSISMCDYDSNYIGYEYGQLDINSNLNLDTNDEPLGYSVNFGLNSKYYTIQNINSEYRNKRKTDHNSYFKYLPSRYDIEWKSNLYKVNSLSESYLLYNEKMKKDPYGTFIMNSSEYYKENVYYDFDEVKEILIDILDEQFTLSIEEEYDIYQIKGYELLDVYNPLNIYEKYYDSNDDVHYSVILNHDKLRNNKSLQSNPWYITTQFTTNKTPIVQLYDKLNDNYGYYADFRIFSEKNFISKNDLLCFLSKKLIDKCVWPLIHLTSDDMFDILKDATDLTKQNQVDYLTYTKYYLKQNNRFVYMENLPMLPVIINKLNDLQLYNFNPYDYNNVKINNFFTKDNSNNDYNIYVDTYNLNKYIVLYNSENRDNQIKYVTSSDEDIQKLNSYIKSFNIRDNRANKINYYESDSNNYYEYKELYAKLLNKEHIEQYINKLLKPENIFNDKFASRTHRLLDELYVKERIWHIDENSEVSIKDRYITLYEYLLDIYQKNISENVNINTYRNLITLMALYNASNIEDYSTENDYVLNLLSKNRNSNSKFNFTLDLDNIIELDLFFKKKFIILNDDLCKLLYNERCYLYLYIKTNTKEDDNLWNIYDVKDNDNRWDIHEITDYIIPLFTSVFILDSDVDLIRSMLYNNKIKNNKLVTTNENFFKEINVDSYALGLCDDNKLKEALTYLDITIPNDFDDAVRSALIKTIKETDEKYYYETFIPSLGITLYSIYGMNHIDFKNVNDLIPNTNCEYNEETNLNVFDYNGTKYGFYMINLLLDNTNNTFNINNSFDVSSSFMTIDNRHIITGNKITDTNSITDEELLMSENKDKYKDFSYLKSIFRNIQPFIKFNVFKDFASKNKDIIVFPNESEIYINYINSRINPDDEYKYTMLKDSDTDVLYSDIIKYSKSRKIKLLRYFDFITPLIEKKNIIKDVWEHKFIVKKNNINIEKFNILCKNELNIYKYSPVHLCTSYDFVNQKELSYELVNQYEYKHFNDNSFYNLKEEIIINIPDIIEYEDLVSKYESYTYTLKIFEEYINKTLKSKLNINIILFLFNKYNVNYMSTPYKLNSTKSKRLYKISYKFNLK